MKKVISILFASMLLIAPLAIHAQSNNGSANLFQQYTDLPPFSFTAAHGKVVTNKDLDKNKPTLIFLFSVDCSHCQHETKMMTENIDQFKDAQILMITPFKYKRMMEYYKEYDIGKYPNVITMGSDSTRSLNMFFKQQYYPGIYIYNKKNQIVYHNEGSVPLETLIPYLKRG